MNIEAMELLKKLNQMMDEAKTQSEIRAIMKVAMWVEEKMNEYDKALDMQFNQVEV